ncbi:hypothetical protein [Arthrobacter hankyongi]|nr:hypothetical protein [Arthrobacter hankyongi]
MDADAQIPAVQCKSATPAAAVAGGAPIRHPLSASAASARSPA